MVRNAPKHQFMVKWGGSGVFVAKNSDATSWHELLHKFGPTVPNATKLYEMHENVSLGSNGVDRVHSLRKILTRLRGRTFALFGPFCTEFRKATKRS